MKLKGKFFIKVVSCILLIVATNIAFGQSIQNISSRSKTSLDGLWQVIIDPMENGMYSHSKGLRANGFFMNEKPKSVSDRIEYDFDRSDQLNVPGDWNTQMEKLYLYEGTIWYKRSFAYNSKDSGRTLLYFEGVNYTCRVYLNGQLLGEHEGGFTPFQFNVTDLLQEENFLIVKVDNKRNPDGVPTDNFDWWNYGGITRSVWLVDVADTYINDYQIRLSPDRSDQIEGWVTLSGADIAGVEVRVEISELSKVLSMKTDKNGKADFKVAMSPDLWSPESPKLYYVGISSGFDSVRDQIGFKQISTAGTKILLNGKPIFLKGISIHEEAPFDAGRISGEEQAVTLLKWAKQLGCNFVRLAHYPHNEFMIKEAERMGFLIWSEIPVYWTINYTNQHTYSNAENQLKDMINRDKNRVAIGLWSVANETPMTNERLIFLQKLIDRARELDDTRLITAALNTQSAKGSTGITIDDPLGEYIDVIGINSYCGWYAKKPQECADLEWENSFNKPMIMSEIGAAALQGLHGGKHEVWTEEYQDEVYRANIEMMSNIEFLAGLSPWILKDFRSPRRHLKPIQNDYNRKGLISEQGIKKKAFFRLQQWYLETD